MNNLFSVSRKTFLVTGGSRGIGFHIAQGIHRLGGEVIISSRSEADCVAACDAINKFDGGDAPLARYAVADCGSRNGCENLVESVGALTGGKLDVLVNNAGCAWGEDLDRESGRMNWGWDKVLDLNVKAPFYLARAAVGLLSDGRGKEEGEKELGEGEGEVEELVSPRTFSSYGRIINIGSVAGLIPQEAPTHAYDTSKAALHHLTKKMAADYSGRGVTVNCVAPGFVPTRMSKGLEKYASMEVRKGWGKGG